VYPKLHFLGVQRLEVPLKRPMSVGDMTVKKSRSISCLVAMMAARHLADARRTFQLISSSSLYSSSDSLDNKYHYHYGQQQFSTANVSKFLMLMYQILQLTAANFPNSKVSYLSTKLRTFHTTESIKTSITLCIKRSIIIN